MKKIVGIITAGLISMGSNAQDLPNFTQIKKIEGVESSAEEVKPIFDVSGDKMYFVRAYHEDNIGYNDVNNNEDIWMAERDDSGKWTALKNEKTINDKSDNSIIGAGKEGNYYLLNTYQDKSKLEYGIAVVKKEGDEWSKPKVIPIPKLKYNGNFYDFYITPDEKVLIISIKGTDTRGEEDLYVSINRKGKWSTPRNLGAAINTKGYEFAPFLSKDKKFLYFSTNGREDGFGDADIYVSERLDGSWRKWSKPRNLGKVINSAKMDSYFTVNNKGEYFFSSNRDGGSLDIYQAEVVEQKLSPTISKVDEDLVTVENIKSADIGSKLVLNNILFDIGKFSLLEKSFKQLDLLSEVLLSNTKMKLEISGHTSSEGDDEYNLKLSDQRAKTIVDYLQSKGISKEQLIPKGYGETQPIESNETEKGREKNRRVEIKILSK